MNTAILTDWPATDEDVDRLPIHLLCAPLSATAHRRRLSGLEDRSKREDDGDEEDLPAPNVKPVRRPPVELTARHRAQIIRLREEGWSLENIGREVGVSGRSVSRVVREAGLSGLPILRDAAGVPQTRGGDRRSEEAKARHGRAPTAPGLT